MDSNSVTVGDFNTSITSRDILHRQKVNKEILALNYMLEKMNLRVIYRRFHTKAAEYTFFSSLHVTFSRRDHILGREIF